MEAKIAIAPHERSIPAVKIIIVWPIAIEPTTATCCKTKDKLNGSLKFGFRNQKTPREIIRTSAGLSVGYLCSAT